MPATLAVYDCPTCGAPLPSAADGSHVTCDFCGGKTLVGGGDDVALDERKARKAAESLYNQLARPPSTLARMAVVLTHGWLWILGSPFMLALFVWLGSWPMRILGPMWESLRHERLMHVVSRPLAFALSAGPTIAILVFLLVMALFGVRVSARRELQIALACKPPAIEGGASQCRHCGADLRVPEGALGVRCAHCDATNLVSLPPSWVASAKTIQTELLAKMSFARAQEVVGRKRMWWAASWRLPLVAMLIWLGSARVMAMNGAAGFNDFHLTTGDATTYQIMIRSDGDTTIHLRGVGRCDAWKAAPPPIDKFILRTADTDMCEGPRCDAYALFALGRADHLKLYWASEAPQEIHVGLASRNFIGGFFGGEGTEDTIAQAASDSPRARELAVDAEAKISGFYVVHMIGTKGAAVMPCVQPAK